MIRRVFDDLGEPLETAGQGDSLSRFWIAEQRIVVLHAGRDGTEETAFACNAICDRLVAEGKRIYIVNDWSDVETYPSETRKELTRWALAHRKDLIMAYYWARWKMLTMALQVAQLTFARGLRAFSDGDSFYRAFQDLREYVRQRDASR